MANRHVETDSKRSDPKPAGKSPREYGHSSGDRNTKHSEQDWQGFSGGRQRDATPTAPGATPQKDDDRD